MDNPASTLTIRNSRIAIATVVFMAVLGLVAVIVWYRHPERRVQRLIRVLETHSDPAQRASAARDLAELAAVAQPAIPALARALDDDGRYLTPGFLIAGERWVYQDAFETLKRIGGSETAKEMVEVVRQNCARDGSMSRRSGKLAGDVLIALGREALPVAPQLATLLGDCQDAETATGIVAVLAVNAPAPNSPSALELPAALSHYFIFSGSEVRIHAAKLLLAVAPGDDKTMVRLIDATQTQDIFTAHIGDLVLRNFGTRAIPDLVERLGHVNHPAVVTMLKTYPAADVLAALRESLEAPDVQRRRGAAQVIAGMPIRDGDLEPIRELLHEIAAGAPEPRAGLCVALLRREPGSKDTAGQLIQISSDEPEESPFSTVALFGGITFDDVWAFPWLEQSLVAASPIVRVNAALALERFGPGARAVLPALLTALKDEDEQVRKSVAKAVAAIDR